MYGSSFGTCETFVELVLLEFGQLVRQILVVDLKRQIRVSWRFSQARYLHSHRCQLRQDLRWLQRFRS